MTSITDLKDQLLTNTDSASILPNDLRTNEEYIVVLRNYKFHRKLSIEIYRAARTQQNKIKNPLTIIDPVDIGLRAPNAEHAKFYLAIARFQNSPTAPRTPADLDALKLICSNPLAMRFFTHDPEFSEKVSAGSIRQIVFGRPIKDMVLHVNQRSELFEINLQAVIEGSVVQVNQLDLHYDYFLSGDNRFHLLNNFHLLKVARFFSDHPAGLKLTAHRFNEFKENVLNGLQDHLRIHYNFIQPATAIQPTKDEAPERIIYLVDHDQHIGINPVIKYGKVEVPVLSKRIVYDRDVNGNLYMLERDDKVEINFISLLLRQHPDFEEQLDNDLTYFYLHRYRFLDEDWFLDAFEVWKDAGIHVLGFNKIRNNKLNSSKASINIRVVSGLNWFNTDINVRFGKKKASLKQLHQSVRNKTKYVQLDDGTMGILPDHWLKKFETYFNAGEITADELRTAKSNYEEILKNYKADEIDEHVHKEIRQYALKLSDRNSIEKVTVPEGFNATLRHYQQEGLNWLNLMDDLNFGGCLADDMGLGKTVQVLAFVLHQRSKRDRNTNLVVVPTSLVFNWQEEAKKFAPSLKVFVIHGTSRITDISVLDDYELVITTYGTLMSDINLLKQYVFNYVFLDESQNIKNIESQRYQTVCMLQARNRLAITGTPVENNSFDLYAQLSFACPGLLGSRRSFRDLYSMPIDKFQARYNITELQKKVAPFILRRTKAEVATELPEKTEIVLQCPMGDEQRKVYDSYEREIRDFVSGKTEEELKKDSMHVLKGLTRLRQICDSPQLLEDEKLFGDRSSKIEVLIEQIENNAPGHKLLVFSQFVTMLQLIKKELDERNIPYVMLTGNTKDRETVVHKFQTDKRVRVFLVSLKAGGTGLNLTEADYVYLVEPWWNPAVENQAIDRTYRIGQKKNVVAVRLVCPDTVEEKMLNMQDRKRSLFDLLIK